MIRKIILIFVVLFVLIWLTIAHLAKSKIIALINNSQTDNIKILYKDASISGFPFSWKVKFASPKITITDQLISREISSDYLNCTFDYKLGSANLDMGKILYYNASTDEENINYKFKSNDNISVKIGFKKVIYKINKTNSLRQVIKNIQLSNPYVEAFNTTGEELFSFSGINLDLQNNFIESLEQFSLKLVGDYKSFINNKPINNAQLIIDADYIINETNGLTQENNINFDRKVVFNKASLNLNESSCDIKGQLLLNRSESSQGKIRVEIVKYGDFIDILIPEDFIFSKSFIKNLIAKAASIEFNKEQNNKAEFDIELSEKGIFLGKVNLLEINNN